MLINFTLTAYAVLVVTGQCFGIQFLELPGFDSDVSHDHRVFKKPLKTKLDTVHRPHHKKSVNYKNFRRMEAKTRIKPKNPDQYHDADISNMKIADYENIHLEPQKTIKNYEMINQKDTAVIQNMEPQNIDTEVEVQTSRQYKHPNLKQEAIPNYDVEEKHWQNTQLSVVRENIEFQNNNTATVQTNHKHKYPPSKQKITLVNGDGIKHWQNAEIPVTEKNIESQNIAKKARVYNNKYPLLKQDVTPLPNIDKRLWGNTNVRVGRENIEPQNIESEVKQIQHHYRDPPLNQNDREDVESHDVDAEGSKEHQNRYPENIDAAEIIETQRESRYPSIKKEVEEDIEPHNDDAQVQAERQNRYPILKQEVIPRENSKVPVGREKIEDQNIDSDVVQRQRQRKYPPLNQNHREDIETHNIDARVQTERQDRYLSMKQKDKENVEPHNNDVEVQKQHQIRYPPIKEALTTDYYIERRHWLVAKKDSGSANIPPIKRDDKDAILKAKINLLVNQTVRDTDEKVKSIQNIKDAHKEKAPYKIGYVVSMVKKSRDVLNELFNVAVKHRDEWKALEQLKIFELIVHTNVDTTNLVRQLVEIHVNSTSVTGDTKDTKETKDTGGRRVVLI